MSSSRVTLWSPPLLFSSLFSSYPYIRWTIRMFFLMVSFLKITIENTTWTPSFASSGLLYKSSPLQLKSTSSWFAWFSEVLHSIGFIIVCMTIFSQNPQGRYHCHYTWMIWLSLEIIPLALNPRKGSFMPNLTWKIWDPCGMFKAFRLPKPSRVMFSSNSSISKRHHLLRKPY